MQLPPGPVENKREWIHIHKHVSLYDEHFMNCVMEQDSIPFWRFGAWKSVILYNIYINSALWYSSLYTHILYIYTYTPINISLCVCMHIYVTAITEMESPLIRERSSGSTKDRLEGGEGREEIMSF